MLESYENFSDEQVNKLKRFVTNTDSNIFVLHNLPEVIKGALFSRYSRSSLGLRTLLLKEFIIEDETSFEEIVGSTDSNQSSEKQFLAIKKAQNFYDRILDGYGDDSIGELGGAHLALENVSMLAAKVIEDCRIGGSPLEKSTRYIYFDQKINDEFLFYKDPVLMTSAFKDEYIDICNHLFETYQKLIPPLTEKIKQNFPKTAEMSTVAYTSALRAKVLDCLRGLLPAGTLTNMGVYGNGRFFQTLIQKLNCENLSELQDVGKGSFDELAKVIPSFIRRGDPNHKTQIAFQKFSESMRSSLSLLAGKVSAEKEDLEGPLVNLIDYDRDAEQTVAAMLLFPHCNMSIESLKQKCQDLSEEEINSILDGGASARENRRHKSPRALEHINFTFEILADFGVYRDLQRHRILTQDRQLLNCDYGYFTPQEIVGTEMEEPYHEAMSRAKEIYDKVSQEFPEEAQYIVPMAYNIRWYFKINLRALQWLAELRSSPQGHTSYRWIAQEMTRKVLDKYPAFERYFKYVDFSGYELGRLGQEENKQRKKEASA